MGEGALPTMIHFAITIKRMLSAHHTLCEVTALRRGLRILW